jgi:putative spermidine/putrescine transport system permease protein
MATTHPRRGAVTSRRWPLLLAMVPALPALVGLAWSAWAAGGGLDGAFTLGTIVTRLGESLLWQSAAWSLAIALAATALATITALAIAMTYAGSSRRDRVAQAVASLPLPVPPLVVGLGAILLLAQSGLLARAAAAVGWIAAPAEMPALLHDARGIGLVLALAWKEVGFLALVACSVASQLDPELGASARTLGMSPRSVSRRIVLPLVWRGLAPSVIAVLVFVLGNYELAALLGPAHPQPLAVAIAERSRDAAPGALGETHAAALLACVLAAIAVFVHERTKAR